MLTISISKSLLSFPLLIVYIITELLPESISVAETVSMSVPILVLSGIFNLYPPVNLNTGALSLTSVIIILTIALGFDCDDGMPLSVALIVSVYDSVVS